MLHTNLRASSVARVQSQQLSLLIDEELAAPVASAGEASWVDYAVALLVSYDNRNS